MVGVTVSAGVEAPALVGFAGAGGDGCNTTEVGPSGFGSNAVAVVTGGGQQDRGSVDGNAVDLEQLRRGGADECFEMSIKSRDLIVDHLRAARERDDRGFVAYAVTSVLARGRSAAALLTSILVVNPASCVRSSSGAVMAR